MGASVGNMHINFQFLMSCRWKQAYCLRLKSPSCIDFSEWNMTGSYSQMLSSCSSKLLSLLSWEKGHSELLLMELRGKKDSRYKVQWIWRKKERAWQKKKHLFSCPGTSLFLNNLIPLLLTHLIPFLIYVCTSPLCAPSLTALLSSYAAAQIISSVSPPAEESLYQLSATLLLYPLHCLVPCNLPKSLAMSLSSPYPSASIHWKFTAGHTGHSLPVLTATQGTGNVGLSASPHQTSLENHRIIE